MQRNKWEFPYTADKLLAAAEKKYVFHSGRLAVWQRAQDDTKAKIQAEGLQIDEGVDILEASYSNRRQGPGVRIDDKLLSHLNEATTKIAEHKAKVKDYEAWIDILKSQGQASFALDHDDWLFFFSEK